MRIGQKLIIPLLIIALGNINSGIIKNEGLLYYLIYVVIFIVPILILQIIKKELAINRISIIMLLFSVISVFFEDITALNSVFFFTYSMYILKNDKKIYWIYGIIYISVVILKFSFSYSSEFIVHLGGISFVIILYQHYIHPKKIIKAEIEVNYLPLPVKKSVIDIIKLRILGFDWWEINDKLELTCTAKWTNEQVNKEMKLHHFKNRESFIYWLVENGAIKTKKPLLNIN